MPKLVSIVLFALLFSFGTGIQAQSEDVDPVVKYDESRDLNPVNFDKSLIEEFKSEEDFDYTEIEQEESIWQQFMNWLSGLWHKFWTWLLGDYEASPFWSFFIELIPYLIIAGMIVFVIWLFYKLNPGARILKSKEQPDVFFTEEEEIIRTRDIRKLIQNALNNGEFRLAVRYYYLLILKKLSNAEIINYEFDKTNRDYINEITSEELNVQFAKVTSLYDYIWYGNFELTETDFNIAQDAFRVLERQIPDRDE